MKRPSIFVLCIILFSLMVNNGIAGSKMAVTTLSEKALAYYNQGQDLLDKLRLQDANEHFKKAIAEDDQFAMAYLNLAFTAQTAKSFFENIDKAVALADNVSEGERLQILALQAGAQGDAMTQRQHVEKLAKLFPNDERALNALAVVYFVQQEYEPAIELYEKIIAINPNFSPPYNQLGYAQRALGNYDKAESAFQQYIKLIPDDPNPYDSYAELLLKLGRYDESIAQYRKALEKDPHFVISFTGIATNLDLQGKGGAAREELQKLYASARNDGERRTAHFATAISYVYEGKIEQAVAEIKKSRALAEGISDAAAMAGDIATIGNILLEAGQPDDAQKAYKKSLTVILESDLSQENKDQAKLQFLFSEAVVAAKTGDIEKAQEKAELFLKGAKVNNSPFTIRQAHMALGIVALAAEQFETAVAELKQANQQNPYNLYRLAKAYKGAGDEKLAKSYCEQSANFRALSSMNQAFIQSKAEKMLATL